MRHFITNPLRFAATATAVATALVASPAQAMRLVGTSAALFDMGEVQRDGQVVSDLPLGLLLSLSAEDLGIPSFSESRAVLQGWGRLQLGDDTLVDNDAELGLAYVEASSRGLRLRLGRQHLVQGVGRMLTLDGLDARFNLPAGVSFSAFAGSLALPAKSFVVEEAWTVGGRAASRLPGIGELGVSFRHEAGPWGVRHQELGVDGFYFAGPLRLTGVGVVSLADAQLVEARLAADWTVLPGLTLTADAERVLPSLLLPQTSIFAVFTEGAHDQIGGEATYRPSPYWDVGVGGDGIITNLRPGGYDLHLRAVTYREAAHHNLIGLEVSRRAVDDEGYSRARLYTSLRPLDFLAVSADLYGYYYDQAENDVHTALIGQLSGVGDLFEGGRLVASVAIGTTPRAELNVEGQVRFVYAFDAGFGQEVSR